MLLNSIQGSAVVTAPAKGATDVIARFAGERFHFMAPDALLASTTEADWLIVDEAAAIPGPLLDKLVSRFPRVLLTTTVQVMKARAGVSAQVLRPVQRAAALYLNHPHSLGGRVSA